MRHNRERREERRREAAERQEARNKLTPSQQVTKLNKGGFQALRERARLAFWKKGPAKTKKGAKGQ